MDTSCNMDINTLLDTVFISSLSSHTIHWQKLQRRYLGQSVGLSLQTLDNILYILPPGISKVLAVVKTPTPKKICALLVHSVSAICSLELNQSGGSRSIVNSFTRHFVDRPSLVFRARRSNGKNERFTFNALLPGEEKSLLLRETLSHKNPRKHACECPFDDLHRIRVPRYRVCRVALNRPLRYMSERLVLTLLLVKPSLANYFRSRARNNAAGSV
ncbi:unnamed protein product [Sphagnum balticum]